MGGAIADFNGAGTAGNLTITNTSTTTLGGANTYSGTTTVNSAAAILLVQGSNSSAGAITLTNGTIQLDNATNGGLASGTLTLTSGTLQALTAARSLSNYTMLTAATVSGSQNLTFTGSFTNNLGDRTLTSSITGGGILELAGPVYLSETAGTGRTLTIAGTGPTIVSGAIADANPTGLAGNLTVTNTGLTTLSGTTTLNAAGATLLFSGSNSGGTTAIQNGTAIAAGGASNRLSTGPLVVGAMTNSGVVQLGNVSGASDQTVSSLSTSGSGTTNAIVGGNTSNSTLTVNQSGITVFAGTLGGGGTNQNYLNLVKSGAGSLTISGASTYTGTTSVTGGSLTLSGTVNGTPSLSVSGTSSSLALTGPITGASSITSVTVADGSTLSLINGAGDKLTSLTSLTLGSASGTMSFLNLNVGDTTNPDQATTDLLTLLAGGTLNLFAGNQVTFNLTDAGLNPTSTYNLLELGVGWGGLASPPVRSAPATGS